MTNHTAQTQPDSDSRGQSQTMPLLDGPIEHSAFQDVHALIRECHDSRNSPDGPLRARITGVSGVGKSFAMKFYAAERPPQRTQSGIYHPVAYIPVPAGPTEKDFTTSLLVGLGVTDPGYGTAKQQYKRFCEQQDSAGVEIFLLDEIQHFTDKGKTPSHMLAADTLKTLIDDTAKPWVLGGAARSNELFMLNSQLRTRFTRKLKLRPFSIETPKRRALYIGFLKALCKKLDPKLAALFTAGGFADALFYATDGLPRLLIAFSRYMRDAMGQGKPASMATAQEVFLRWIWDEADDETNPFHPHFAARRLCKLNEPYWPSPIEGDNHA